MKELLLRFLSDRTFMFCHSKITRSAESGEFEVSSKSTDRFDPSLNKIGVRDLCCMGVRIPVLYGLSVERSRCLAAPQKNCDKSHSLVEPCLSHCLALYLFWQPCIGIQRIARLSGSIQETCQRVALASKLQIHIATVAYREL